MGEPKTRTMREAVEAFAIDYARLMTDMTNTGCISRAACVEQIHRDLLAWSRARELRYGERTKAAASRWIENISDEGTDMGLCNMPLPEPETEG